MEIVYLETTYDNVRLWMGAFKSMSVAERGYGSMYSDILILHNITKPCPYYSVFPESTDLQLGSLIVNKVTAFVTKSDQHY